MKRPRNDIVLILCGLFVLDSMMGTLIRELVNTLSDAAPWALMFVSIALLAINIVGLLVSWNLWRKK